MKPQQPPSDLSPPPPPPPPSTTISPPTNRDFLRHLEIYLSKRDGVDKLLKISRYASKIILSSSFLSSTLNPPLTRRIKDFETNVGLSRKAFRLGKFIQDVNALRSTARESRDDPNFTRRRLFLAVLSYGGEGIYYFIEQIVWLSKSGLIDARHARELQKLSACAEFVGYIGSISLKIEDLMSLNEKLLCLSESVEVSSSSSRGDDCEEDREKAHVLNEKKLLKKMSIVQDVADGLMALADIRDGKGKLSSPLLLSCAGLLSALISTHKNWSSC